MLGFPPIPGPQQRQRVAPTDRYRGWQPRLGSRRGTGFNPILLPPQAQRKSLPSHQDGNPGSRWDRMSPRATRFTMFFNLSTNPIGLLLH